MQGEAMDAFLEGTAHQCSGPGPKDLAHVISGNEGRSPQWEGVFPAGLEQVNPAGSTRYLADLALPLSSCVSTVACLLAPFPYPVPN